MSELDFSGRDVVSPSPSDIYDFIIEVNRMHCEVLPKTRATDPFVLFCMPSRRCEAALDAPATSGRPAAAVLPPFYASAATNSVRK